MKNFRESFNLDKKNQIGKGAHKEVYLHPDDENKVIALHKPEYSTNEKMKAVFYLRKILHFLMPSNIPEIHLSTPSVTISEKRHQEKGHAAYQRLIADDSDQIPEIDYRKLYSQKESFMIDINADPAFKKLIEDLYNLGFIIDTGIPNFSRSPGGEVQYLDSKYVGQIDLKKLKKEVSKKSNEPGCDATLKYLNRLEEISKLKPELLRVS